jgi:hypothetical protein
MGMVGANYTEDAYKKKHHNPKWDETEKPPPPTDRGGGGGGGGGPHVGGAVHVEFSSPHSSKGAWFQPLQA